MITYDITSEEYRHWTVSIDPPLATLTLRAHQEISPDSTDGIDSSDAQLSSFLRVDIELADVVQRLRFEHPDVGAVVLTGGTDDAFSTGIVAIPPGTPSNVAVNVFAFRNEVRCAIEDASANSGQHWLAALNDSASGPGYELALAADEIILVDDGRSAVKLPETSTVGRLPATGGLARLLDKRHVRPDLIDAFCCSAEGVSGDRALSWGFVDWIVPAPCFTMAAGERALFLGGSTRPGLAAEAVELGPLWREEFEGGFAYPNIRVDVNLGAGEAVVTIVGPPNHECFAPEPGPKRLRSRWWPLAVCRELDDTLLLLRSNWPEIHTLVLRTEGDPLAVASADVAMASGYEHDWFVREVVLYWKRTLKRLDLAWQSVIALVEPGSCFVGTLLEVALAADRIYMVDGAGGDGPDVRPAEIVLTGMNFGPFPGASGLTRLESRFPSRGDHLAALAERVGDGLPPSVAAELGLVTDAVVPAEWHAKIRQAIEERAGLTFASRVGLAATLHSAGPETLETKIFSGLTDAHSKA